MSDRRTSSALGGMALMGIATGLALFAAKNAREGDRQDAIHERLAQVPGVEVADIDVRTGLPWQQTRVTGVVALSSDGIDEFEERFDECVRTIRRVMDDHQDYTAEIELRAEPVDAALGHQDPVTASI